MKDKGFNTMVTKDNSVYWHCGIYCHKISFNIPSNHAFEKNTL